MISRSARIVSPYQHKIAVHSQIFTSEKGRALKMCHGDRIKNENRKFRHKWWKLYNGSKSGIDAKS